MKIKSYVFFLVTLYLLSGIPVKAMQTLHMMQIQFEDGSYGWSDLAGRLVSDFKNQTIVQGDDKLHHLVPVNLGKVLVIKKIYQDFTLVNERQASFITLEELVKIIQSDVGLCDYERICSKEMLNSSARKAIADFIRGEMCKIRKMFRVNNTQSTECKFVYSLLKNRFCKSIGKTSIEDIKIEINQEVQSLYEDYKDDIQKLGEKIQEQKTRYKKMTVIYEKQKKNSYIAYVLLMFIGFFGWGSFMYLQSYEKAVVDFILFSGCLWVLKDGNDSISETEYSMANLQDEIEKDQQKLANM